MNSEKLPELYPFLIKFNGREENAIGVFYDIKLYVLLESEKPEVLEIINELRASGYETNKILRVNAL